MYIPTHHPCPLRDFGNRKIRARAKSTYFSNRKESSLKIKPTATNQCSIRFHVTSTLREKLFFVNILSVWILISTKMFVSLLKAISTVLPCLFKQRSPDRSRMLLKESQSFYVTQHPTVLENGVSHSKQQGKRAEGPQFNILFKCNYSRVYFFPRHQLSPLLSSRCHLSILEP